VTLTAADYREAGIPEAEARLLSTFWGHAFPTCSTSPWIPIAAARAAAALLRRWHWPAEPLEAGRRAQVLDLLLPTDREPITTPADLDFRSPGFKAIRLFLAPEACAPESLRRPSD
jgi:hypothetical protein